MPGAAGHTQRGNGTSLARRRQQTVCTAQLAFGQATTAREDNQEPRAIGGRQQLGFERGRIRHERNGRRCGNGQDDPITLNHRPIGEDQRAAGPVAFDTHDRSLVVDRQSRGQRPRYRLEPGICGERRERARAVGHHGQRRRRRRLRKVLKVVSPKRRADDSVREGPPKAPGAPCIGGHVNVRPLGRVSRIGLRQARKLAGQLPARLGGFTPAHHARSHHRESVGGVGHSLRVDDDSCARTNRAERDAEALGHARDDTVGGGQKVSADLDPTIGDRCGLHASARAPARLVDLDVLAPPGQRIRARESRNPSADDQGFHDPILATHASIP